MTIPNPNESEHKMIFTTKLTKSTKNCCRCEALRQQSEAIPGGMASSMLADMPFRH